MYRCAVLVLLFALSAFRAPGPGDIDHLVINAAETQLAVYIAKIPAGQEANYGFTDKDNLEQCAIGKPYRMLVFTEEFYSTKPEDDVNYLAIKNEWRAPVTINGDSRVLLTVSGNPGNFNVSAMGGVALARELQQVSKGLNKADAFYLLHVGPLKADFLVSESDNSFENARFLPLASAAMAIPAVVKSKKNVFSLGEVQQMVKDAIAKKSTVAAPQKKKATKKQKSN